MARKSNAARVRETVLSGQKFKRTHQATVDGILGPNVIKVESKGSQFYNKDNWTQRAFTAGFTRWASLNRLADPDRYDVEGWMSTANHQQVYEGDRGIVIASTPDELPAKKASALMGGGYHEAWHTEYSRRTPVTIELVWPKLRQHWELLNRDPATGERGWHKLTGPLLEWSNIVEDIRIERLGCRKYPGSRKRMEDLQDLILEMEAEGRQAAEHRGLPTNDDLAVVMGTFRDLGLGYSTTLQDAAIRSYKARSPAAYKFVTEGPLKPLLDRAINLTADEDMECLWLAMEIVAAIVNARGQQPQQPPPPPQPPQEGQPQEGGGGAGEGEPQEGGKPPEGPPKPRVFKVGDRALLKSGPHAGCEVEVTRAGLPDPVTGEQALEFSLVEPD